MFFEPFRGVKLQLFKKKSAFFYIFIIFVAYF